ncbi:MAG TPA: ABC transporter substrate-binding protein, partial [Candidatus Dormibacteraeota bacterium]|nr:ABC transporter substrate-binding protein [Candidatus Dormibacteraeota bacterium]
ESVTNWCLTLPNPLCNPQPSDLRGAGPNNFFRIAAPDPIQGRAIARYMANSLKIRRAAAFTLSDDFDDVTLSMFAEEFKRDGGDLVLSETLPPKTANFGPFLQAARSHGAEAIFAATENDACRARAQMNGIFPQGSYFIGMDYLQESDTCIPNAGDSAEGMLATVSVLDMQSSREPVVMKIAADYRRAYPKSSPIDPYAFAAYDCTLILIDAITRAVNGNGGGFPTRAQIVDVIAHSKLRGAVGTYSFEASGDALSPLMALYQVKGGKWEYVGQIDASASPG